MTEDSRSKSRSPSSSSASTADEEGLSVIRVDSSEAGLVLGRGGATKRKIENAADVDIELVTTEEGDSNVELRGPGSNRELGRDYICFLLLHKKGESLDINLDDRDDCSCIDVPQETIGYVTGRERSTMNRMEEDTDTLMFFLDRGKHTDDNGEAPTSEKLIIFGPARGRRIAQLKLMSAIETKSPGFFLDHDDRWNLGDKHDPKLGLTTVKMTEGQFTYALGRRGTTRRKLEKASGAIMEYIGYTAFICGTKEERRRGRDYLNYLLDQREGEVHVDTEKRTDVTVVECPEEYIGYITGHRGSELRLVEDRTGTFCFMDGADISGDAGGAWWASRRGGRRGSGQQQPSSWNRRSEHRHHRDSKETPGRLLILCFDPLRRDDAEEMIRDRIEERVRQDIARGIQIPPELDNKHSNEEVQKKREEKWGPRPQPAEPPKKDDDGEASPRSVSLESVSKERSKDSSRPLRSVSAAGSRESRSRSMEADEESEQRKEPSESRNERSSRGEERSSSRGKRRRSLSHSEEDHHHHARRQRSRRSSSERSESRDRSRSISSHSDDAEDKEEEDRREDGSRSRSRSRSSSYHHHRRERSSPSRSTSRSRSERHHRHHRNHHHYESRSRRRD